MRVLNVRVIVTKAAENANSGQKATGRNTTRPKGHQFGFSPENSKGS